MKMKFRPVTRTRTIYILLAAFAGLTIYVDLYARQYVLTGALNIADLVLAIVILGALVARAWSASARWQTPALDTEDFRRDTIQSVVDPVTLKNNYALIPSHGTTADKKRLTLPNLGFTGGDLFVLPAALVERHGDQLALHASFYRFTAEDLKRKWIRALFPDEATLKAVEDFEGMTAANGVCLYKSSVTLHREPPPPPIDFEAVVRRHSSFADEISSARERVEEWVATKRRQLRPVSSGVVFHPAKKEEKK